MAYVRDHAVLAFGGPLYDGGEEWSMSLRLDSDEFNFGDADQPGEDALCDAYAEAIRLEWVKTTCIASGKASLGWVKFNKVGTDGHYLHVYTNRKDYAPVVVSGGSASNSPAPQLALVVTLRTAAARGLAHAGRIFVPVPHGILGSDGRVSTVTQTAQATWAKGLLDAINAVDATLNVVIGSKVGAGQMRLVTRVETGRVIDTMRSRRTSLSEDYAGLNLA